MNNHAFNQQVQLAEIADAQASLQGVINRTPLQKDLILSAQFQCNVYLKREDLQVVRSFKIRGAYHLIQGLSDSERQQGVVCASAGNHAQGVAFACNALQIQGKIYMPTTTPRQKISQVKMFGGAYVEVILQGDTFDD